MPYRRTFPGQETRQCKRDCRTAVSFIIASEGSDSPLESFFMYFRIFPHLKRYLALFLRMIRTAAAPMVSMAPRPV